MSSVCVGVRGVGCAELQRVRRREVELRECEREGLFLRSVLEGVPGRSCSRGCCFVGCVRVTFTQAEQIRDPLCYSVGVRPTLRALGVKSHCVLEGFYVLVGDKYG